MSLDELNALAKSLNAVSSKDKTELIYNIIDAESMQAIPSEKPKRSRKTKEEKPDAEKEKASTPKKRSRKSNEKAVAEETKAEESKSDNTAEETPAEPLAAPAPEKKRRRRISEVKAEAAAALAKLREEEAEKQATRTKTAPQPLEDTPLPEPISEFPEETAPTTIVEESMTCQNPTTISLLKKRHSCVMESIW